MFQAGGSGGGGSRPSTPPSRVSSASLKSIPLEDTANRNSSFGAKDNGTQQDTRNNDRRKSQSKAAAKRFLRDGENCDPNASAQKKPRLSGGRPNRSGSNEPTKSPHEPRGGVLSFKKAAMWASDQSVVVRTPVTEGSSLALDPGAQSFFNMISSLKAQENEFPPGSRMEDCIALDNSALQKMHGDWRKEQPNARSIHEINSSFGGGPSTLYAAILRLDAHPIGYILFAKMATALGMVPSSPPSKLVHLYVSPAQRQRGHGSRIVHWFMKNHVKAVKHFSVLQPNFLMRMLLKKREYKEIISSELGDASKKDYLACVD